MCSDTPGTGERVQCIEDATSTDDIEIDTSGLTIETTADQEHVIAGHHGGSGTVRIESRSDTLATEGQFAHGILASHKGSAGDVVLRAVSTTIETKLTGTGAASRGIWAETITAGKVDVEIVGGRIATAGDDSLGIDLDHFYAGSDVAGALTLDISGGAEIETAGATAFGMRVERKSHGDIALTLRDTAIRTAGVNSDGIFATQLIDLKPDIVGDIVIDLLGGVRIATAGESAEASLRMPRATILQCAAMSRSGRGATTPSSRKARTPRALLPSASTAARATFSSTSGTSPSSPRGSVPRVSSPSTPGPATSTSGSRAAA